MKKEMYDYYKTIGELQNKINQTKNFDLALQEGLKIILGNSSADYAVMWYQNNSEINELHPYFWICPMDFTAITKTIGQGIVGKTVENEEAIICGRNNPGEFVSEFDELNAVEVSAILSVPFEGLSKGCILFMKKEGDFTEEEADVCQILAIMTSVVIKDGSYTDVDWLEGKPIISARGITKEYKSGEVVTKVLKGVDLDVMEGEFLVVLGESGCGKSTFLNIIGGMDNCNSGTFTFMGKNMESASEKELTDYRRDNIGFIFQSYNLMPNLTAKQNLDLIAELVKNPMNSYDALELVGLADRQDNYPSQLSGGQQQRVSIARALVKRPKVIFADEPTAALDYETSIEVLTALENVIAKGTTIVMVTHNEEIAKMAHRVVRFREGKTYEVTVNKMPCKAKELVW